MPYYTALQLDRKKRIVWKGKNPVAVPLVPSHEGMRIGKMGTGIPIAACSRFYAILILI
jgi:hypothetical protein